MSIGKKQSPCSLSYKNSIKDQSKLFAKDVHDSSFQADVKTIPNMYFFMIVTFLVYIRRTHTCVCIRSTRTPPLCKRAYMRITEDKQYIKCLLPEI